MNKYFRNKNFDVEKGGYFSGIRRSTLAKSYKNTKYPAKNTVDTGVQHSQMSIGKQNDDSPATPTGCCPCCKKKKRKKGKK